MPLSERILQSIFCFPPPGREYVPERDDPTYQPTAQFTALQRLERDFGPEFIDVLSGAELIDIGCGRGEHILAAARAGAAKAVGMDIRRMFDNSQKQAEAEDLSDRVCFTINGLETFSDNSFDIVTSRDCFEHYSEPERILNQAYRILRPGGRFFISFGPPWFHPRGAHMFFMFKRPWAHLVFPESVIMRVRGHYKNDGALHYGDVPGGLNKMTVSRFLRIVAKSGFQIEKLEPIPIRNLPIVSSVPLVREFFTSVVHAQLRKPN